AILATGQKLVEMKTGEGKTITFWLPLFLYGLSGRGAHCVTVNDYLAKRDGEYAGYLFTKMGLSVGVVTQQGAFVYDVEQEKKAGVGKGKKMLRPSHMNGEALREATKKEAYECDVVYGTNNEFGFDYLRDNMVRTLSDRVHRELYFCVVDEADSVLIDEARTPLIISAPAQSSNELYATFAKLVKKLKEDKHYVVEEKEKAANLTDEGIEKMEELLGVQNIWEDYRLAHHLENALKAKVFYRRDKEYLVRNGEVLIVDEFTGRALAGRRYSEGLHQAIEAQEGVAIQQESRTLATITFQNFFRLYKVLTGGSGTILTEQEEFFKIYNLEAAAIPTNMPLAREDKSDKIYKTKEAKFNAVAEEIAVQNETGRPILVGTTSIADSETVSRLLDERKIEHEVLNAKHHEREAQIVAKAGEVGAVTVATNMAGRGTDIPLGEGAKESGGLLVIGTERHEARRIDNQLRGRSGRQGDPGESRFYASFEDQIMKIQGGDMIKRIMDMTNLPEDLPIESRMATSSIERAQKKMEGMYFDSRKRVVEYDDVINQQRIIFYTRRYRYLKLAEEFEELMGKDKSEEKNGKKFAEKKNELADMFSEVIEAHAHTFSSKLLISEDMEKEEQMLGEVVDEFLALGDDELFIETFNNLKLYKDEIGSVGKLKEVLRARLKEKITSSEELHDFLVNLLESATEHRIDTAQNLPGLIRTFFLNTVDEMWTLHLDYMQDLREGIGLRGVAQLDPLTEYKNEGFRAFSDFVHRVNANALQGLLQVNKLSRQAFEQQRQSDLLKQARTNSDQISDITTGNREIAGLSANVRNATGLNSSQGADVPEAQMSRRQRRAAKRAKTRAR
ncbi:MAG: preprotein translocase subunit SecA, partial [Candidatus Dojkabacteria bacterium]